MSESEAELRQAFAESDLDLIRGVLNLVERRLQRAGVLANSLDAHKLEGGLAVPGTFELVAADDPPVAGTVAALVRATGVSQINTITVRCRTAPSGSPLALDVTRLRRTARVTLASVSLAAGSLETLVSTFAATDLQEDDWLSLVVTAADSGATAAGLVAALGVLVPVVLGA